MPFDEDEGFVATTLDFGNVVVCLTSFSSSLSLLAYPPKRSMALSFVVVSEVNPADFVPVVVTVAG